MKRGTPQHPKFKRLCRALSLPSFGAVGLLESIWLFAQRFCPSGDIGKFSNEDIADDIGWTGNADELINALCETGWIDRCEVNRLLVHDWEDHCDRTVKKYLSDNELSFAKMKVNTSAHSVRTDAHSNPHSECHSESHNGALGVAPSKPCHAKPNPSRAVLSNEESKTATVMELDRKLPIPQNEWDNLVHHVETCVAKSMGRELMPSRNEIAKIHAAIPHWYSRFPPENQHGNSRWPLAELIGRTATHAAASDLRGQVGGIISWMESCIEGCIRSETWPGEFRPAAKPTPPRKDRSRNEGQTW